jgi:hypothetical protein
MIRFFVSFARLTPHDLAEKHFLSDGKLLQVLPMSDNVLNRVVCE